MKTIASGVVGSGVGTYSVVFDGGKLKVAVEVDVAGEAITALENAIPGQIDNAVLEIVRNLLKSL